MNKQLYRLVFSKHLGMLVPVSEAAVAQPCKASGSRVRGKRRAIAAMLAIAGSHSLLAYADQPAGLVRHSRPWVNADIDFARTNANQMTIKQTKEKAILNWQTLNLTKGQTLTFEQGSKDWSALNRVFDVSPSFIAGNVNAIGHIYFVNQNGVVFGNGAQINVGSLTATTLDNINTDDILTRYNNGIVGKETTGTSTLAFSHDDAKSTDLVMVEAGAVINAASGGRVMLLAPRVENNGLINTPDGQTILAAGKKVYLSDLNDFAGLLVEVSGGDTANGLGTVTNLGNIVANHGNVTLVGLAVNQEGRISASTSVRANGSIYLKARETAAGITFVDPTDKTVATTNFSQFGTVKTSKNSVTEVTVDTNDKEELQGANYSESFLALKQTAVDRETDADKKQSLQDELNDLIENNFKKSLVEIEGRNIDLQGRIIAKGGNVSVQGLDRVLLGNDALIDVSGIDAIAPMSRNQLKIQLFSEQLRDSPILRGGSLFGKFVYIDKRYGAGGLLSDEVLAESEALIGTTVAERMSSAGKVDLKSKEVIVKSGATVDVSGGSITYEEGFIEESLLLDNGKLTRIRDAIAGVNYQGTADGGYTRTYKGKLFQDQERTWDLQASTNGSLQKSFFDGADAGVINIKGLTFTNKLSDQGLAAQINSLVLDGNFIANTRIGEFQRDTANILYAQGGTFTITNLNSNLSFVSNAAKLATAFVLEDLLPEAQKEEAQFDVSLFTQGFNKLTASSLNKVNVNAPINTAIKGDIALNGSAGVNVNADIKVPSGTIILTGAESDVGIRNGQKTGSVVLANGVTLSTAGVFTNDTLGVSAVNFSPIAIDGGNITINNGLVMGEGSRIDASAGAYFSQDVKEDALLGKGGNISLSLLNDFNRLAQVKAYGFTQSGSLSVSTGKDIQLGGINPNLADTEWISEGFFKDAGFSSYNFSTIKDNAVVNTRSLTRNIVVGDAQNSSVNILPQQKNLVLNADAKIFKTNTDIAQVATAKVMPDYLRSPASISLNAVGTLKVNENASVRTDAPIAIDGSRGDITMTAGQQLTVLGDLIAPAAAIALTSLSNGNNPTGSQFVYDNTLSLYVGENALLSATGVYFTPPASDGNLRKAQVIDAGSIELSSPNSVVVLKQGSVLDVSGSAGNVDVLNKEGYQTEFVFGAAGTIGVEARNGFALDGTLKGNAQGTGEGGKLNLALTGTRVTDIDNLLQEKPNGNRTITVTQNKVNLANNITENNSVSNLISDPIVTRNSSGQATAVSNDSIGKGAISAQQITEGGFDQVSLLSELDNSSDRIVFESGLNLFVPASLSLSSAAMTVLGSGNTSISAPNISFGSNPVTANPVIGDASLSFFANNVEAVSAVFTGVKSTSINAQQDIKNGTDNLLSGFIKAAGTLNLTARQIYPATNSSFDINVASGNGSLLNIQSNGVNPILPYAASGTLNLGADDIVQNGAVRAPLGIINLNAKNNLTLGSASLTSVSAEGQILPFGKTSLGGQNLSNSGTEGQNSFNKEKAVNIGNSETVKVDMQAGARVDISGGGDTLAYEFLPGIGGTNDFLGRTDVFAVIPSLKGEYQPTNNLYAQLADGTASKVTVGQAIYLSGVEGLPEGTYTLLPARYALLPGAFVVQTNSEKIAKGANIKQLDGSSLVSGYMTRVDGTSRDAVDSTFKVTNGKVFRENFGTKDFKGPSEYLLTSGDTFYKNLASSTGSTLTALAADAGALNIRAKSDLSLNATIVNDKVAGALGSRVNIAADNIKVVSATGAAIANTLQISAGELNKLNADSLLLGGTRTVSGNTQTLTTTANSVTFANDAANAVNVKELLVTANDTVTLSSGSVVNAVSDNTSVGNTQITTAGTTTGSGDGAFFAVSAINDVSLTRNNVSATQTKGTLDIQVGSTLAAQRSMVLDATKATTNNGKTLVGDNGTLSLGANTILLGDSGSASGTKVSADSLVNFGKLSAVALNAYQNIDIYGALAFGNNALDLTFNAGGIRHINSGDVVVNANIFTLKNSSGTFTAPSASNSNLTVNANNIQLGATRTAQDAQIAGFNTVNLNAANEFTVSGTGKVNVDATQTNISSARVTADTGADYKITTTGQLATTGNGTQLAQDSTGLGAKLSLQATALTLGGNIELLSGGFSATSTTGDLVVASGANISTKSFYREFDENYSKYADAGVINLTSNNANVNVNAGALLDVSGGETAGDAGVLNVSATKGSFNVADGTLKGTAVAGEDTGSFTLDVNTLSNFSQVNTALETGQLNESREMRVRTGDVTIAGTATAHNFVLSADAGKIDVAGTINADGNEGGNIELYASGNVTLKSTAQLLARGTEANADVNNLNTGSGGSVTLSSNSQASINAVSAEAGALIDVSRGVGGGGAKGDVTLRGYRGLSGNTNTVNVATTTTAAIKGAGEVNIMGVKVYNSNNFTTTTPNVVTETSAFYAANTGSGSYFATQDGELASILPEIEVRSSNDADLRVGATATDINLNSLFTATHAGKGGALTLRASNNLLMDGSLSHSFSTATSVGVLNSNAKTFNLNLVAGADYTAANPNAVNKATPTLTRNFTLANNKIIRTGTGDINIAAGGNMTLGNVDSVIYTAGQAATDVLLFTRSSPAAGQLGTTGANYLTNGGDIEINIQGNITGKNVGSTAQSVNQWLFRQGGGTGQRDVSWWLRPDLFKQGIAALGGGDVNVKAGGNIVDLSVSVPTTAQYDNFANQSTTITPTGNSAVFGGGDMSIQAGGNISSGLFYAGRGNIILEAGGDIAKSSSANSLATVLALQDASADVSAAKSVTIESVFNPTVWAQSSTNSANNSSLQNASFFTYGDNSSVNINALTGNVELGRSVQGLSNNSVFSGTGLTNATTYASSLRVLPSILGTTAFNGEINTNFIDLMPSKQGDLTLLATGNVTSTGFYLSISDSDPALLANVNNPLTGAANTQILLLRSSHAAIPVHQGSNDTAVIVSRDGDINLLGPSGIRGFTSAKPVYMHAGKDVIIDADIQHPNKNGDVSVIKADRDIKMATAREDDRISVAGSGELLITAGRNIDLGTSKGIVSIANTENTALSDTGANLTVVAGLGKDGVSADDYIAALLGADANKIPGLDKATLDKYAKLDGNSKSVPGAFGKFLRGNLTSKIRQYLIREYLTNKFLEDNSQTGNQTLIAINKLNDEQAIEQLTSITKLNAQEIADINNIANLSTSEIEIATKAAKEAGKVVDLGEVYNIKVINLLHSFDTRTAKANESRAQIVGKIQAYIGKENLGDVDAVNQLKSFDKNDITIDRALKLVLMDARSNLVGKINDYLGYPNEKTPALNYSDAIDRLSKFDKNTKQVFVYRHFLDVMQAAGLEYVDTGDAENKIPGKTFLGDNAIAKLFPSKNYQGDLLMFQSQINTARNADIHLLVPGGLVNAGLPVKGSGDIGIVTERGGRIFAFANSNFIVNQSKVLTQFGGDIMAYVNNGDVDAGRGSKTSVSTPERALSIDVDGNLIVEFKSASAGSGFRAQTYDPDSENGSAVNPSIGNSFLFAPRGLLNVGEAGVGGGSVFIGALTVQNANNIDAGSVSGVTVDTGSLGGGLSNVANVASSATDSVAASVSAAAQANTATPKQALPSVVTVRTIRVEE